MGLVRCDREAPNVSIFHFHGLISPFRNEKAINHVVILSPDLKFARIIYIPDGIYCIKLVCARRINMTEAKATARHKKMAQSKKDKYEELKHKVSVDQNTIAKKKEDYRIKSKNLSKEEKIAAKAELTKDIQNIKASIAKTKEEMRALKAEIKADEAKAKAKESEKTE